MYATNGRLYSQKSIRMNSLFYLYILKNEFIL